MLCDGPAAGWLSTPSLCRSLRWPDEVDCSNSQMWSSWAWALEDINVRPLTGLQFSPAPAPFLFWFNYSFAPPTPSPQHPCRCPHIHHRCRWHTQLSMQFVYALMSIIINAFFRHFTSFPIFLSRPRRSLFYTQGLHILCLLKSSFVFVCILPNFIAQSFGRSQT